MTSPPGLGDGAERCAALLWPGGLPLRLRAAGPKPRCWRRVPVPSPSLDGASGTGCERRRGAVPCRSVPCRAVLQGSHSAAVCSLTPRPGRAARCRDPATAQIPPAPGKQPFCFASEEAPVPFQISLSLVIIVLQSVLPHSCPQVAPMASSPPLPPIEGGIKQKAVPLLSSAVWGPFPCFSCIP